MEPIKDKIEGGFGEREPIQDKIEGLFDFYITLDHRVVSLVERDEDKFGVRCRSLLLEMKTSYRFGEVLLCRCCSKRKRDGTSVFVSRFLCHKLMSF